MNKFDTKTEKKRILMTEFFLRYWRLIGMIIFVLIILFAMGSAEAKAVTIVGTNVEAEVLVETADIVKDTITDTFPKFGYNNLPLNVRAEMSVESEWLAQYPSKSTIFLLEDMGEWYRVNYQGKEGFIKREYVFDSVEIYQRGKILQDAHIYVGPEKREGDIIGDVIKDTEEIFVGKTKGYLELSAGGFVEESVVTFEFEERLDIYENKFSVSDMESWNMINLEIQYYGTLAQKTRGEGVTKKSALNFRGDIPIYEVIAGEAYFPVGREIYKIPMDKFASIQNVGNSYEILAAYRTTFYGSSSGRVYNIELVTTYLDGVIIPAGKTFSYNKTTGPRDESMGYKEAPVLENGEYVQGFGGGVCQPSSTIYAAIVSSGNNLRVTARKPHGNPASYLPIDMDATVSYGGVDLKFVNENPFAVKLNVTSKDNVCLVTVTRVD